MALTLDELKKAFKKTNGDQLLGERVTVLFDVFKGMVKGQPKANYTDIDAVLHSRKAKSALFIDFHFPGKDLTREGGQNELYQYLHNSGNQVWIVQTNRIESQTMKGCFIPEITHLRFYTKNGPVGPIECDNETLRVLTNAFYQGVDMTEGLMSLMEDEQK